MVNSGMLDGLTVDEAKKKIIDWLTSEGKGHSKVNYKLRDWVFSRQRYWGEPIPMVYCEKCGYVPIDEKDLPLRLPMVESYEPTDNGESPLAKMTDWINTTCPCCGGKAKRETDTMPQWAGSSWYYLRYMDPHNKMPLHQKRLLTTGHLLIGTTAVWSIQLSTFFTAVSGISSSMISVLFLLRNHTLSVLHTV